MSVARDDNSVNYIGTMNFELIFVRNINPHINIPFFSFIEIK